MTRAQFRQLVAEALDQLPDEFARHLDNVEVVVEDEPSPELLREMELDPREHTLFGLYQGIPLTERGAIDSMSLPDKITIYYRPLVKRYRFPRVIRRQIVKTVIHEVAHFFGIDEDEIGRSGY